MYTPLLNGQPFSHSVNKVVCVGRNYAEHALELNNPIPSEPLLFFKPGTSVADIEPEFSIPAGLGEVHHELEITLLIGEKLTSDSSDEELLAAISGVGLGLDLTLRDVQSGLKKKGHPWERAKAFDGACPVTGFVEAARVDDWNKLNFLLRRNGEIQQQGDSSLMLFPVLTLLKAITSFATLEPGDLVLTGTPAGVGPLFENDKVELSLEDWIQCSARVTSSAGKES